jgi:hypothetical protein
MIFKVVHGKDVFELNPELLAIQEFTHLTARQMTFVVLATDYKSPFRKLNTTQRRTQAAVAAGYRYEKNGKRLDMNGRNIVDGKVSVVEAACKTYQALQHDEDYETLASISTLIREITKINTKPDKTLTELEKAVKLSLGLDKLMETKKKLEEILDMREEAPTSPTGELLTEEEISGANESDLPILSLVNEGKLLVDFKQNLKQDGTRTEPEAQEEGSTTINTTND